MHVLRKLTRAGEDALCKSLLVWSWGRLCVIGMRASKEWHFTMGHDIPWNIYRYRDT